MKTCKKCGETKPLDDFHKLSKTRQHTGNKHTSQCKRCARAYMQSPERKKATLISQRKRRATPEGCRKHREENRRYQQTEKGKEAHKRAYKKWSQTTKGRLAVRKWGAAFRKTIKFKEAINRYRKKFPEKRKAGIKLYNAMVAGKIIRPSRCSVCDKQCVPEGHHFDYSKPLEVVWACKKCHSAYHQSE